MSTPTYEGGRSAVASGSLVVTRRRGRLLAGAIASLVVALAALVAGMIATGSDRDTLAGLFALITGVAVVACIVCAVVAGRAKTPLLVVDDAGVTTGHPPKVSLPWGELERIRVFPQRDGGDAIGIVPTSVDQVAARLFGDTANAKKYADRLRSLNDSNGAPIVVRLGGTSTAPADAVAALNALAAGRCAVTR